jgi:protein-tyrosine phosphatase
VKKHDSLFNNYRPECRHWREPVRVGRQIVLCSSYFAMRDITEGAPGFAVYLAEAWRDKLGFFSTNGSYIKRVAQRRAYPCLFVDWKDFSTIPFLVLDELVEICLCKMRQGKVIEIACNAGHGRTGALLACLIIRKEHLSGERAISEVRRRYCRHAIESKAQEEMVKNYSLMRAIW